MDTKHFCPSNPSIRGCFIGKRGIRADTAKVKAIVDCSIPKNQKDLRTWLGLTNYLHKHSENYADMAWPLADLLRRIKIGTGERPMMTHFGQ